MESSSGAGVVGVYEVFRVESIEKVKLQELAAGDFAGVRKRFTFLKAIESAEEILGAAAGDYELAITPPPAHMIVDRHSFATLMKSRVEAAIGEKEKELRLIADAKVCQAADRISHDRIVMAELFKAVFAKSQAAVEQQLQQCVGSSPPTSEQLSALQCAVAAQRDEVFKLLDSSHFRESQEEEENHQQQQPISSSASSSE